MKSTQENKGFLNKVKVAYQAKAEGIANNRDKLITLLNKASSKFKEVSELPALKESKAQVEVVFRMVRSHYSGEYKGLSNRTLGLLVLGLFYFVLPIDFIPDFIPIVGYVDDLTVLVTIFNSLNTDIKNFLDWERTKV